MGRGGKAGFKRNFKRRIRHINSGSDDSDEDYVVSYEENEVTSENSESFCNSLHGDVSEESFGRFVDKEELEEEEDEKVKKFVRLRVKKGSFAKGKAEANETSRKRKRVSYKEEEDDGDNDYMYDERDDDADKDDDDEEFLPGQDDFFDEEEESRVTRKERTTNLKGGNRGRRKNRSATAQKRRKAVILKKTLAKKGRNSCRLRRKLTMMISLTMTLVTEKRARKLQGEERGNLRYRQIQSLCLQDLHVTSIPYLRKRENK